MLNPGEGDAVMANIGRSAFNTVFTVGNMLGFGIPGALVGIGVGVIDIFGGGSSSPWKHHDTGQDTHQN